PRFRVRMPASSNVATPPTPSGSKLSFSSHSPLRIACRHASNPFSVIAHASLRVIVVHCGSSHRIATRSNTTKAISPKALHACGAPGCGALAADCGELSEGDVRADRSLAHLALHWLADLLDLVVEPLRRGQRVAKALEALVRSKRAFHVAAAFVPAIRAGREQF